MEYATRIGNLSSNQVNTKADPAYERFYSWGNAAATSQNYQQLWDESRLRMIQQKLTQLLDGVSPDGRPIIVPIDTIGNVMYQCYKTNRPKVGDIYSRYIISGIEDTRNDIRDITDRAINIIMSQIRNEYDIIESNRKLTVWNTVLGDFNKEGLRSHAPIKIRKGGPQRFQFHMRY